MSCSLELLNWFEGCYNEVEPQTKPLQLTANWVMLPPEVVDIILDLLKQINFEFYVNNFIRIDTILNVVDSVEHRTDGMGYWEHRYEKTVKRFVGTPPVKNNKYITKGVIAHKQSLPNTLKYIAYELENRKQKSVDGNIKPTKLRCKYVKNIANHVLTAVIAQNKVGRNIDFGIRTYKVMPKDLILW